MNFKDRITERYGKHLDSFSAFFGKVADYSVYGYTALAGVGVLAEIVNNLSSPTDAFKEGTMAPSMMAITGVLWALKQTKDVFRERDLTGYKKNINEMSAQRIFQCFKSINSRAKNPHQAVIDFANNVIAEASNEKLLDVESLLRRTDTNEAKDFHRHLRKSLDEKLAFKLIDIGERSAPEAAASPFSARIKAQQLTLIEIINNAKVKGVTPATVAAEAATTLLAEESPTEQINVVSDEQKISALAYNHLNSEDTMPDVVKALKENMAPDAFEAFVETLMSQSATYKKAVKAEVSKPQERVEPTFSLS